MSGGFFRGTSADQDTRFSNKAAKLLKSQKFPAELDQLVDMTKVKMDVIRPWIANRATEFLGFEDEVLINFIYGLLDGKEVDGKQIQIQLTGFMEKNTGKFMKELWGLLTSAQKNASGIPQQFLDAKAEETRKKKAETDRINYEVQKKKEQEEREAEQERQKKITADLEMAKIAAAAAVSLKPPSGKISLPSNPDDQVARGRHSASSEGKNGDLKVSHGGDRSPLSHRSASSLSRSRSQSYSVSRSPSRSPRLTRRHRSRSISRSPRHHRRSTSPVRHPRSPVYSPPRRKRSPFYARSPPRRRSPSLPRRRSPSPQRRRSPVPRSPRSRRRSPVRSPRRRPMDSQSPPRRRKRSRSPPYRSRRSLSRERNSRLDALDSRRYRDRYPEQRTRGRSRDRQPVDREEIEYERREHVRSAGGRNPPESSPPHRRSPMISRSPDRNVNMRIGGSRIVPESPPPHRSPLKPLHSSPHDLRMRANEERRRPSPYHSQIGPNRERGSHHESPEFRKKQEHVSRNMENIDRRPDPSKRRDVLATHLSERKEYGPRRVDLDRDSPINHPAENHSRPERSEPRRKEYYARGSLNPSESRDIQALYASEAVEYGPGRLHHGPSCPDDLPTNRSGVNRLVADSRSRDEYEDEEEPAALLRRSFSGDSYASNERRHPTFKGPADYDNVSKPGAAYKTIQKLKPGKQMVGSESDADENEAHRRKYADKRKVKRRETDDKIIEEDEDESVSPRSSEERREAKRRKKEEKRIRKEERRRRREERHRRKEERRAGRLKAKTVATVTPPSGFERDYSAADESDDSHGGRDHSRKSYDEEMESEQQRLEIELRRKALESLRARKAISH